MAQRLALHDLFIDILGTRGQEKTRVYFQPPSTIEMHYPCIVYRLDKVDSTFANDEPYTTARCYQVQVIDANPDSEIPEKIGKMPKCAFDRHFTAGNLNHYNYNLYY